MAAEALPVVAAAAPAAAQLAVPVVVPVAAQVVGQVLAQVAMTGVGQPVTAVPAAMAWSPSLARAVRPSYSWALLRSGGRAAGGRDLPGPSGSPGVDTEIAELDTGGPRSSP